MSVFCFFLLLCLASPSTSVRLAEAPSQVCSGNTSAGLLDGRWLCALPTRADGADQTCIFAPYNCRYGYHTRDTLLPLFAAHSAAHGGEPLWIFLAGDSRMRGIWLHWVDLLLEHANLTTSSAFKCWGVEELRIGAARLTWHDMRELDKDPLRREGPKQQLAAVRADFDRALRSPTGRRPDVLIAQFGFDVMPPLDRSTRLIQLSGWDYWKEGAHLSTHTFVPESGWEIFDTKRLTLPMLDNMCDEKSEDRKHFHAACGDKLCGFVNQMQAQMLLTILFGEPLATGAAPKTPPVAEFQMCTACKAEFDTKYCLALPPPTCEINTLTAREPPDSREFCVDMRTIIDGHLIKVHGHDKGAPVLHGDSLFHLPGARILALHNAAAPATSDSDGGGDGDGGNSIDDVDPEVVRALEACRADMDTLKAEHAQEIARHRQESAHWLGMFNDLSHKLGSGQSVDSPPPPPTHKHAHSSAPAPTGTAAPFLTLQQRAMIVAVVLAVVFGAARWLT